MMNGGKMPLVFHLSFIIHHSSFLPEGGGPARVSAWNRRASGSRWTAPRTDRRRDRRTGGGGTLTRTGRGRSLRWDNTSQRPIPPRTSITYRNEKRITRNSWFNPPSRPPELPGARVGQNLRNASPSFRCPRLLP